MKYLAQDTTLGVVSEHPSQIIGAKMVWYYNPKDKFGGVLIADGPDGLGIKGQKVQNVDMTASKSKRIKDAKRLVAEVKKAGKVKMRTLLDGHRNRMWAANPRLNKNTLILRVMR